MHYLSLSSLARVQLIALLDAILSGLERNDVLLDLAAEEVDIEVDEAVRLYFELRAANERVAHGDPNRHTLLEATAQRYLQRIQRIEVGIAAVRMSMMGPITAAHIGAAEQTATISEVIESPNTSETAIDDAQAKMIGAEQSEGEIGGARPPSEDSETVPTIAPIEAPVLVIASRVPIFAKMVYTAPPTLSSRFTQYMRNRHMIVVAGSEQAHEQAELSVGVSTTFANNMAIPVTAEGEFVEAIQPANNDVVAPAEPDVAIEPGHVGNETVAANANANKAIETGQGSINELAAPATEAGETLEMAAAMPSENTSGEQAANDVPALPPGDWDEIEKEMLEAILEPAPANKRKLANPPVEEWDEWEDPENAWYDPEAESEAKAQIIDEQVQVSAAEALIALANEPANEANAARAAPGAEQGERRPRNAEEAIDVALMQHRNLPAELPVAVYHYPRCQHCGVAGHHIIRCAHFLDMSVERRVERVAALNLCQTCLNRHSGLCNRPRCPRCKLAHNSLLCKSPRK